MLVFRCFGKLVAIDAAQVSETMRPPRLQTMPNLPELVCGAAVIRGRATPIIDGRALLGDEAPPEATRLVIVRVDAGRSVGVLVDDVIGIRDGRAMSKEPLPPLLGDPEAGAIAELGRLDGELLAVLRTANLVPESVWSHLERERERT